MTDGDDESLCIFERVLGSYGRGSAEYELNTYGSFFVGQLNISIPPGLGKGYRWIEIWSANGGKIWDTTICSAASGTARPGPAATTRPSARSMVKTGRDSKIIICENLAKFSAMNPLADYNRIAEIGSGWFDNLMLDPTRGDCIGLYSHNPHRHDLLGPTWRRQMGRANHWLRRPPRQRRPMPSTSGPRRSRTQQRPNHPL